jgi:hypothetical protein
MKKKAESDSFEVEMYHEHMDTRVKVACLEQSIGHINQTLIRIEKGLDKANERIDRLDSKVDTRFLWLVSFCFAGFTGLAGLMAHGFHWI